MAKRTLEEQREYMRAWRAARKALDGAGPKSTEPISKEPTHFTTWKQVKNAASEPQKLPRSNYYSDPAAPGGWTETIREMDPKLAMRILDKIAPPRRLRS